MSTLSLKTTTIGRAVKVLAFGTLAAAYLSGWLIRTDATMEELDRRFDGVALERTSAGNDLFTASDPETGEALGFVSVETADGWGGPLTAATWVDPEGRIRQAEVLTHKETPSFYEAVVHAGYFDQFDDRNVTDRMVIDADIDAVSGATISSVGFAHAIREGAHSVGRDQLDLEIAKERAAFEVGKNEFLLILLYAVVIGAVLKKYTKVRYLLLGFSLLFLGFMVSRPISLSHLSSLLLGYVPDVRQQLFWWLLVGGTLAITLLFNKNIYCYWMCPFGGLQEFITLIGGVRIKISKTVNRVLKGTVYLMLWLALVITFVTSNPALGTYEPFAVLFSLKGLGIQWYLVSVAIIGAFIIPRFWCRFFCPVGLCLDAIAKLGRRLTRAVRSIVPALDGRGREVDLPVAGTVPFPTLRKEKRDLRKAG